MSNVHNAWNDSWSWGSCHCNNVHTSASRIFPTIRHPRSRNTSIKRFRWLAPSNRGHDTWRFQAPNALLPASWGRRGAVDDPLPLSNSFFGTRRTRCSSPRRLTGKTAFGHLREFVTVFAAFSGNFLNNRRNRWLGARVRWRGGRRSKGREFRMRSFVQFLHLGNKQNNIIPFSKSGSKNGSSWSRAAKSHRFVRH